MTVDQRDDSFTDGHVVIHCVWFDEKQQLCNGHFDERSLRKVGEEQIGLGTTSLSVAPTRR